LKHVEFLPILDAQTSVLTLMDQLIKSAISAGYIAMFDGFQIIYHSG
jgi:hypothetical protein